MKLPTRLLPYAMLAMALSLFDGWPRWLTLIGAVFLAAIPTKGWNLRHWLTVLGAAALGATSMWLKYGGPDFKVADTPILGFFLLVLQAMYQTPPKSAST